MATTNDLRNGLVLNLEGQLWQVVEFQHVKPGKGPAFVRTKLKNVLSGKTVDKTFNAGLKVETATVDRRDMQYLYKDGSDYVFMDVKSYEQVYVPAETVGEAATFMLENQEVIVAFHDDDVLFVELPAAVVLTISHTEPGLRQTLAIEHPAGEFTVELEIDPDNPLRTTRAALLRTARLLMRGDVLIPRGVWEPDGDGLLLGKESR